MQIPRFDCFSEILHQRADEHPEKVAFTFLADAGQEKVRLTYGELERRVASVAAVLRRVAGSGQRALLLYPAGIEFIVSFLACLESGLVAVPTYPPRSRRKEPHLRRIVRDAKPAVALTSGPLLSRIGNRIAEDPELGDLELLATDSPAAAETKREPRPDRDGLAFIQYTSGSTASPKGVMVSHTNLVHNQEMIRLAFEQTQDSVIVSWLPLYHDMGLIGAMLQPLYVGAHCILMSPTAFVRRPFLWLDAISRYRATTSGGPNFAYDLCVRKIIPAQRRELDLGSWRVAFNGAEPVRAETLERFAEAFAPCGFRRRAFFPCYGLAEATLLVTGGSTAKEAKVAGFTAAGLERGRADGAREESGVKQRRLVGCGRPWLGTQVAIVDPQSRRPVGEDRVGEIWVSGAGVTRGYWGLPDESRACFRARLADGGSGEFLRTGDLGLLKDGELWITGRLKDLIVIRGRNHYPQDLELTAQGAHPALRSGCGAAFAVDPGSSDLEGQEHLVIVYEVERRGEPSAPAIAGSLREAIVEEHEIQPHEVVLVRAGSMPKTSSGKIRRHRCREQYLRRELTVVWRSSLAGEASGAGMAEASEPARSDRAGARQVESLLRQRIAAATGLDPRAIPADRSLACLGMDSLRAVELQHAIEQELGVSVSAAGLLAGLNLRELTTRVRDRREAPGATAVGATAVLRGPIAGAEQGETPLSYGQRGLWIVERLAPQSGVYNLAAAARVEGGLDAGAFRRSIRALVRRHDALRTSFVSSGGELWQRAHEDLEPEFLQEDAAAWSDSRLQARLATEAYKPFDLERGPLLRVAFFCRSPRQVVLLLVVHHSVADFSSVAILFAELERLYQEETGGPRARLEALDLRYPDHVRGQIAALAGSAGERLWAYWQRQLSPEPPHLDLPTDRPRPPVSTHVGGAGEVHVPAPWCGRLEALAQGRDATLYMALLAVFRLFLHRFAGQDDLVVGSPVAVRSSPRLASLVGYFVNPLALRSRLSDDPSFEEFLGRERRTVLDALAHQEYPFSMLAERLQPARDTRRHPLFQVLFVLLDSHHFGQRGLAALAQGVAGARMSLGPLTLESLPLTERRAPFDLMLSAARLDGELRASLVYSSELFDASTIQRMSRTLRTLVEEVVTAPDRPVRQLSLLGSSERHQLVWEWSSACAEEPAELCLHQLFEAQVERTPDAEAIVCGGEALTYRQLDDRAAGLASRLRAFVAEPETRVGLCLERSLEMVVAMLGILKSGAAYVPLDPTYPAARLAFMLEDSGAALVLTKPRLAGCLPEDLTARIVCLDPSGTESGAVVDGGPAPARPEAENLAYLIYTSGSTGRPKAVAVPHRNAVARSAWAGQAYSPEELAGVLASTSICFDLSVFEIFVPLSRGGQVILVRNVLELAGCRDAERVSLVNTVPSALRELMRGDSLPGSVRCVNLAGEPLSRELVDRVCEHGSIRRVINLYGPSEDTTYSTAAELSPESSEPPSIGRPLAGTRAVVADSRLGPVPLGVRGELCLAGVGLSRGYLGRPAATAASFVPDASGGEPGGRLYRTGDLVRALADGNLHYLGRLDYQVKIRGFRVELGEIEAVLGSCPEVRQAVVLAWRVSSQRPRLVAYVVAEELPGPSPSRLREFLRRRLPEHMVPAVFVPVQALPLTPNGKLDRRALAEPDMASSEPSAAAAAPRTPVEELMVETWKELLRSEHVGIYDNFFDLGGHSLLGNQLISRLRQTLQVDLSLRCLFEAPTVAALAARCEEARIGEGPASPPLVAVSREGDLPLTSGQHRLWFLDQMDPGASVYNMPAGVRLVGRLEVAALAASLLEIVRRHEVLRTVFAEVEGDPVQVIAPHRRVEIPVVDLAALANRKAVVDVLAAGEAARGFDLGRGPLLRATLLRCGAEEHVLLVTMHHIVSDGWSLGVFLRELAGLYPSLARAEVPSLPALPIQFADFAHWQRRRLRDEALEAQLAYWKAQLGGCPQNLNLPTDRPRPAFRSFRGATESFVLPTALSGALMALGREQGVTPFMNLLCAFGVLLHRYGGQEDVLLGSPIAHRNRAELEELIGFFVNTLVLRADVSKEPDYVELLRRAREMALDAYRHQDVPLEKLVETLVPEQDPSRHPLFQVVFMWQQTTLQAVEVPGLTMIPFEVPMDVARFDLILTMARSGELVQGSMNYNRDLFDRPTVARMLGHLENLIEGVVANPRRPVSTLPLMRAGEAHQLLTEWNAASAEPIPATTLPARFEAQVEKTPQARAVVWEVEELTYGQLNARANQLARHLRELGVAAESRVGLCVEPSLDLVVAILAVLKAGGAYVPLDPSYPTQRLALMAQDAGIEVLVTHGRFAEAMAEWEGEARRAGAKGAEIEVVRLDEDGPRIRSRSSENLTARVRSDNVAYVIYTSGSTGRPKGVLVTHAHVLSLFAATRSRFAFDHEDVWALFHSYAFDFSVWELWGPLLYGGRLVVVPFWQRRSAESLCRLLADEEVTVLNQTPSAFQQLLGIDEAARLPLRWVIFGGEALDFARLKPWFERRGDRSPTLVNMYGITETTVHVTWRRLRSADAAGSRRAGSLIGRPIAGLRTWVVDRSLRPLPAAVPGELAVGGAGLARGYLDRPAWTARKFCANPFGRAGERLYRSGDLARFRPDGELEYLGRIDHQVKLRGFRIELGEIEAALAGCAGVATSVVTVYGDGPEDRRLVAYLVGPEGRPADSEPALGEIRDLLKRRLPEHMVPAHLVWLDTLPLNANGKLDRKALPAPDTAARTTYEPPRGPVERKLAEIWSEVLSVERVGLHDNFFDLGGHSLLAGRVVSRIRSEFGTDLSLRRIFESPTVAELSLALVQEQAEAAADEALASLLTELENLSVDEARALLGDTTEVGTLP